MTRYCICPGNFESLVVLKKKRNQQTESSCNTCGGRFVVDGIGAISMNMLSTVGLEVSNSVNPELNWKKVTKGRRSRKPVGKSLNWGENLKKQSPKRVGDFSGSDSDKFGEIASEQQTSDKVEHIPIKKRRHLLHSKSPPHVAFGSHEDLVSPESLVTPPFGEFEMLYKHNHSSGCLSSDSYSSSQLAALRFCSGIRDSIVDVKFSKFVNRGYCNSEDFSGIALLAAAACSNCMDDDSATEKEGCFIEASPVQDNVNVSTPPVPLQSNLNLKGSTDRLEKDLSPKSEGECPDTLKTLSVNPHGKDEDEEQCRGDMITSSPKIDRLHWDLNTSMDSWEQPEETSKNGSDDDKKGKLEIDFCEEQIVPEVCQNDLENCMQCSEMDTKISPSVLTASGNLPGPVSCLNNAFVKEDIPDLKPGKDTEPLGSTSTDKGVSVHFDDKDMLICDHLANRSVHESRTLVFGVSTVALVGISVNESRCTQEPACGTDSYCGLKVDSQVPKDFSPKCPDGSESNEQELTFLQWSNKICRDRPWGDDLASQPMKIGSFLENSHRSDMSREDRDKAIGSEDLNGYDSPSEDGELRGSALCSWEENEVDGEVECVDYDSDGNGVYSDAADHQGSEVVEAGSEGSQGSEKRISSASGGIEADVSRRSLVNLTAQSRRHDSDKTDASGKRRLDVDFGVHDSADTSVEGNDVRKRHAFRMRWSYNEDYSLRSDKGKLQPRIDEPLYMDAADKKGALLLQRRRSHNMVYPRPERDVSPEKFVGRYRSTFHVRDRSAGDGHWGNWDTRNRYPSTYHGPVGHGPPRRRSFADLADRFGGMDSRDQRQSVNCSSRDMQRPPGFRRRVSVERDDSYDGPRRILPVNRNYRGYSQKNTRGFRQEGNVPLFRRDRNFSPPSGKPGPGHISLPRRKSRSRSRSSSPRAWYPQRDWNMNVRRQGRSPEPRAENRFERLRVPFKKSGYVAEYGEGFVSPTRRHISPDRKPRWVDDHFRRGRSPPSRGFRKNQRYEAIGPERMKSSDYFSPTAHTWRFPMGITGRVPKFENNYSDRGEMIHRPRHSERRIGHDGDDKFVAGDTQNNDNNQKNTDQREDGDEQGSPREDKISLKIQQ